jgi:sec-independent protein translocase protein TatA
MLSNLTGWHVVIVLGIVVLLFGATRLPALAKSVGQSMTILKKEMKPQARTESPAVSDATPTELEESGRAESSVPPTQ